MECKNQECVEENGRVELTEDDVDDRGEWTRIYYHCEYCGTAYERLITYKTQSSLVESDVLYMVKEVKGKEELIKVE